MSNTPDDPMQDRTVLASAYLDDEVTPDERARVEASPELLAEVEQLRQVRALVAADVEPAPLSEREAHLAAALDVFDQVGATAAASSTPTPIGLGRARRARRAPSAQSGERVRMVLGVAAGLVILAGAGAVIRGVIVGTEDDTDTADEADAAEEPAEGVGPSEADIADELQGENTNDDLPEDFDASEVARDVDALEAPADEPAMAEAEPADEPADGPAEEPAEELEDAAVGAPAADDAGDAGDAGDADDAVAADEESAAEDAPPEVDVVEIFTPQDLADLAAPAAYAPDVVDGTDAEAEFVELPCSAERPDGLGVDRLAEPAFFDGELLNVGADLDAGLALAFRDDCTVALDALLPSEAEFLATNPTVPPTTEAP